MSNAGLHSTRIPRRLIMKRTTRTKAAKVVFATAAIAGILAGVGVAAASAASAESAGPASYSTEALRETIRPWDSITIPALSCPTGYLENQDYSPGRHRAQGCRDSRARRRSGVIDLGGQEHPSDRLAKHAALPVTGTTPHGGHSTATNWDPSASKELIIRLHCTTDLDKAFMDPSPYH